MSTDFEAENNTFVICVTETEALWPEESSKCGQPVNCYDHVEPMQWRHLIAMDPLKMSKKQKKGILMKNHLAILMSLCLVLLFAGCGREERRHRELLAKLDALQADLQAFQNSTANSYRRPPPPLRWAFANRSRVTIAVFQWSQAKMEEAKKADSLPPGVEEKIAKYEALNGQLNRLRADRMRARNMPPLHGPAGAFSLPRQQPQASDQEFDDLSKKVDEAKAPVAEIVDRRNRQASQFRDQFSLERLVGEYAKDRFDLVLDTNDQILYRSAGEVPDITEGVIALFNEKKK